MIFTTSDNKELYYETHGSGKGPSLVFLNGLTQSTASWGLVWPQFAAKHRVILVDFIFQGQSSRDGEWRDFDRHAADVRELLLKKFPGDIVMIGLSYGSLVAQHYAVNYPDALRGLVLLSTFAHKTPYYEAVELAWWRALQTGGYNLMLDIMLPTVLSEDYFANPVIPIETMKQARKDMQLQPQGIFNLMRATRERGDYRTKLKSVSVPTLIIQGERDMLLPVHLASEVHRHIPGSKLAVIPDAGHTLNLEHVAEVNALITDFLNELEK